MHVKIYGYLTFVPLFEDGELRNTMNSLLLDKEQVTCGIFSPESQDIGKS